MPSATSNGPSMSLESSESAKDFIGTLRKIADTLSGKIEEKDEPYSPENLVTMVDSLSDMLHKLTYGVGMEWKSMTDPIELVEVSLDIIQRVVPRTRSIFFEQKGVVKNSFVQLLVLCNTLDLWVEEAETEPVEGLVEPKVLRDRALRTVTEILRCLGGLVPNAQAEDLSRAALRGLLEETVGICEDLLQPTLQAKIPFQISFFNTPRFQAANTAEDEPRSPPRITIVNSREIPRLASLLVRINMNVLHPALPCHWFLSELARRSIALLYATFDRFTSSNLPSGATAGPLVRVLSSIPPSLSEEGVGQPLDHLMVRLLRYRLSAGPGSGWKAVDSHIRRKLGHGAFCLPTKSEFLGVVACLYDESIDVDAELEDAKAYKDIAALWINACLERFEVDTVVSVREAVVKADFGSHREKIVSTLTRCVSRPSIGEIDMDTTPDPPPWRARFNGMLAPLYPNGMDWMEDDDDAAHIQNTLDNITRRIKSSSVMNPLIVLRSLQGIGDLLGGRKGLRTFPLCFAISVHILEKCGDQATTEMRRDLFKAVSSLLKHHHSNSKADMNKPFIERVLVRGITDGDRRVRLSAGNAVASFAEIFKNEQGSLWTRLDVLFEYLHSTSRETTSKILDTMIIAAGKISESSHPDIMGQAVCFLVTLLSHKNLLVRGNAYSLIMSAAKHQQKPSPYLLLQPYFDKLAPYLVGKMDVDRMLLAETCKLLGMAQTDFIAFTLNRTLPAIVVGCDRKVLAAVTKEISSKSSAILMKHAHDILAHVFLQSAPGKTEEALQFMIKSLAAATGSGSVNAQSVVKSCIVSLLAELVTRLGHENPQKVEEASQAIKKVEVVLLGDKASGNLSGLLKTYILGIITNINDMLQDVQGKKNVEKKKEILRSLGFLVKEIGSAVSSVAPQIMATFQTMASVSELSEASLESWYQFLVTLGPTEIGPHVGLTSAVFATSWSNFSEPAKTIAQDALSYIVVNAGDELGQYAKDLVDLPDLPELRPIQKRLVQLRGSPGKEEALARILDRSATDNYAMIIQGLRELKDFMSNTNTETIRKLLSGPTFDPLIGDILVTLLNAASRESDDGDLARILSFECLSVLGAVDADRCELKEQDSDVIILGNYQNESEKELIAMHLISTVLVRAFRSTSDIKYQSHLAYTIQELLVVCGFKPATGKLPSASAKRKLSALPKHVLETITPLLEARYTLIQSPAPNPTYPIYPNQTTYREWIQMWVTHLISLVSSPADKIFGVFRSAVRNKDVVVAHSLLPHLVLNLLSTLNNQVIENIRVEIRAVLEDQVDPTSVSTPEKRLLCAQAIFMVLDHLNRWVRKARQSMSKRNPNANATSDLTLPLTTVDSVLGSIEYDLMGQAALQCRAYARSLMNFELHILKLLDRKKEYNEIVPYYEKLHEIYAHLDDPDGMEGVATLILSPSLEHQIRNHEINGRWTSAQSCWEVRIQQEPNNVDFHMCLLRCLRNLGHYDSLRTHVTGLLTRQPSWRSSLVGFQAEGAWMVGDWQDVQKILDTTSSSSSVPPVHIARLLLALRSKDESKITSTLSDARLVLGEPVAAAGVRGYRRAYEAALNLHLTHELECIYRAMTSDDPESLVEMSASLEARLDATLPTFHSREAVLALRRTAFSLFGTSTSTARSEVGRSWLASAKIARKAGHWQTAYSAILQAQQNAAKHSFIESTKLLKAQGETLRALRQLEDAMKLHGMLNANPEDRVEPVVAKAHLLRARWMDESERFDVGTVYKAYTHAAELQPKWESGHFHIGRFQDENWKNLSDHDRKSRGLKMNHYTVKTYARAIKLGSKYIYQTVPRLLTLWLDLGGNDEVKGHATYTKINDIVANAIKGVPPYKWFTAFPQMVSRMEHKNVEVRKVLFDLIQKVISAYPKQAMWLFASVIGTKNSTRRKYGSEILSRIRDNPNEKDKSLPRLIKMLESLIEQLLVLCNHPVGDTSKPIIWKMRTMFPSLHYLGTSELFIPLQESLTVTLPPTSSPSSSGYQPFPVDAPTFKGFGSEVEVMSSLAKPRKFEVRASNGLTYTFLAKPKDDLRKDARLMDLNSIINKLMKGNAESRRRRLHIRTYGVVTLNEECGLIQWVPNTTPIRPILAKFYTAKGIAAWSGETGVIFKRLEHIQTDAAAATLFENEILKKIPPILHEWFIETFPEPTTWLTSRLNYGRTAAVMSIIGWIIGLGDRHCENILLDENTGDAIHVDFNCLFEAGKLLGTPERVPFRLTQNMVSALGVSGVEGIFRTTCEITLQLLRDNRDSLMSVLDAFVHDPLVDFEEKFSKVKYQQRKGDGADANGNRMKPNVDLKSIARDALNPIGMKLRGVGGKDGSVREATTSNLVQMLIQDAMDNRNLAKMYVGWAPMY